MRICICAAQTEIMSFRKGGPGTMVESLHLQTRGPRLEPVALRALALGTPPFLKTKSSTTQNKQSATYSSHKIVFPQCHRFQPYQMVIYILTQDTGIMHIKPYNTKCLYQPSNDVSTNVTDFSHTKWLFVPYMFRIQDTGSMCSKPHTPSTSKCKAIYIFYKVNL